MLSKPFSVSFFLSIFVLPCVFGHVELGRKVNLSARETESEKSSETYVVIFDAGSSGTRVHLFRFDENIDLLQIDGQLEIYAKVSPGLSTYAENPQEAASSIVPLLEKAVNAIPENLRSQTPVKLGVRSLFSNSLLLYEKEWVLVLSGTQEGTYMWVAMNYLLGHLGEEYSQTVGIIDLGGASVQMAYAISAQAAENAPRTGEQYITEHHLKGTNYYLYVHSYLSYGQDAARAEILKSTNDSVNYCILSGYNGTYIYNGAIYNTRSSSSGSNYKKCKTNVLKALNVNAKCEVKNCTFNGVWNGGGGAGQDKLYLASAFFYVASDDNIIDRNAQSGELTPAEFKRAAISACALSSLEEAHAKYPNFWSSNLPYLCMDLVYQYTLLTTGFGLSDEKEVTVIDKVKYGDFYVEAKWPLGNAIETASASPSTKLEVKNMYQFWSHAYTQ
ncbi:Ectonucleoside triphosphate diphosphohydrolase 5 [Rhynchospora pubera]|uniref:Ectonucleoside triphosphate diphosphohydrolase 5 n=1 Tax=Rhynchospora pubera TaxID=906938 RepID=A0AAV8GSM2_9POAL|nr:Ectonucleoside triphosphate diphosphohydrolase 5 [Rhynchospora pubera]